MRSQQPVFVRLRLLGLLLLRLLGLHRRQSSRWWFAAMAMSGGLDQQSALINRRPLNIVAYAKRKRRE